jgi:hypothetical protein
MGDLILGAGKTWNDVFSAVQAEVQTILKRKRADVAWKLASVREEFERQSRPTLRQSRQGRRAT